MLILKEEWDQHPKMLKAVYLAGDPRVEHFWFKTVSAVSQAKTDGVVEVYRVPLVAQRCGLDLDTTKRFVDALVSSDLFHDAAAFAKCRACKEALREQGVRPGADDLVVHDFLDHNPSKRNRSALGRKREKRKNDLNRASKHLKVEVYERDRGLCRYCGCRPQETTPNLPDSLEFDHVDPVCFEPNFGNFHDNIVTSCRSCNRAKSERTPDEAGMVLLAAGTTTRDIAEGRARTVDTPSEVPAVTGDIAGVEGVGSGSVRGRSGPGSGSGRDRGGSPATTPQRPKGKGSRRARGRPPPGGPSP